MKKELKKTRGRPTKRGLTKKHSFRLPVALLDKIRENRKEKESMADVVIRVLSEALGVDYDKL